MAAKKKGLFVVTRAFAGGGYDTPKVVAAEGEFVKDPIPVYWPFIRKATPEERKAYNAEK